MIGFNDEETKHLFFTKLDADKQIAFAEVYRSLVFQGMDMHITGIEVDAAGRLKIIIRVNEQT